LLSVANAVLSRCDIRFSPVRRLPKTPEIEPGEHCTTGVSELNGPKARRKDCIFTKGFADVRLSKVVFKTLVNGDQPTVSDHAAVFVRLGLP